MFGTFPCAAVPVKEPFCPRIDPVSCPQDLRLDSMSVFWGVNDWLMQPVLWALADLARLCCITAVRVSLWLVHEDGSEKDACPPPDTVRPLDDLVTLSQRVPSLQEGTQALVCQLNAAPRSSIRSVFSPADCWAVWTRLTRSLASSGFFLVEHRNHANNQPAARLRSHIVMKAAKGYCQHTARYILIYRDTYIYWHILAYTYRYATYSKIHTNIHRYIHILTYTDIYIQICIYVWILFC
jgi:hypothetical protein